MTTQIYEVIDRIQRQLILEQSQTMATPYFNFLKDVQMVLNFLYKKKRRKRRKKRNGGKNELESLEAHSDNWWNFMYHCCFLS